MDSAAVLSVCQGGLHCVGTTGLPKGEVCTVLAGRMKLEDAISAGIAKAIDDYVEETGANPTLEEISQATGKAAAHLFTCLSGGHEISPELGEISLPRGRRWARMQSTRRR